MKLDDLIDLLEQAKAVHGGQMECRIGAHSLTDPIRGVLVGEYAEGNYRGAPTLFVHASTSPPPRGF